MVELEKRGDKAVWNVEILPPEDAIMMVCVDVVSGEVMPLEEKSSGELPV